MKVTVIPIVIGALGSVTKEVVQGLEDLEIKGRVKTIQTISLLKSARILGRVLDPPPKKKLVTIGTEPTIVST